MDATAADELVHRDDPAWADLPTAVKELVRRLLSGIDQDGNPASISTLPAYLDGTFDYRAGDDGTPTIPDGARVVSIAATTDADPATIVINDGDEIEVAAHSSFDVDPGGLLLSPTIVFTGTVSYFVELVLPAGA